MTLVPLADLLMGLLTEVSMEVPLVSEEVPVDLLMGPSLVSEEALAMTSLEIRM